MMRSHSLSQVGNARAAGFPNPTLPTGYTIEPVSCGVGYHVKRNGRTMRQDRKPMIFNDLEQSVEYAQQHATDVEEGK